MLTYDMNRRGEQSLYSYLYHCIRHDIETGAIAADDRLPSKRTLAKHLGVSLITVEGAYAQLQAEGYLYTIERRGYFAMPLPTRPVAHMAAIESTALLPSNALSTRKTVSPGFTSSYTGDDSEESPVIDLSRSPDIPTTDVQRMWARALRATLSEEPDERHLRPLPAQGSFELRQAIAQHVHAFRGMEVDPAHIIVGSGAQTLYNLIIQLLGRDCGYAVEDPGYRRLTDIYRANDAAVSHIPLDEQGMSVSSLEESGAAVAHVMPSHQFPTGRVTSIARRYELLGWAAQNDARYLIEDDYDCEFRLAGRPIPALQSIDRSEKVIYTNTFARGLSPDIRVAYMILPAHLMDIYQRTLGFYSNTVSAIIQNALTRILTSGDYERHINRTRNRHRALQDALIRALEASPYGNRLHPEQTDAGLHFILRMDIPCSETHIVEEARQQGLKLAALSNYRLEESQDSDADPRFIIHYSGLGEAGIPSAVEALTRTIEHCLAALE